MSSVAERSARWPAAAVEDVGIPGIRFAGGPCGFVIGGTTYCPISITDGATDPGSNDPDTDAAALEVPVAS